MCKGNEPHSRATQSDIAIIDYMMAKHGLERNQVMAQRDAKAAADEAVIKNVGFVYVNLRVQECCSYGGLSLQCKSK